MSFLHGIEFLCDGEKNISSVKTVITVTVIRSLSEGMLCSTESVGDMRSR